MRFIQRMDAVLNSVFDYKLKTTHNIEGILTGVEILARIPDSDAALISKVTIYDGTDIVTRPYFGAISESYIARMIGQLVTFTEQQYGILHFKHVHQLLETSDDWVGRELPKSEADDLLKEFYH